MAARRKVLVVEHDAVLAQSLEQTLTQAGCLVVTMADGAAALRAVAAEDFDLMFADTAAPGLGGVGIVAQVKAQRPWTVMVVITGEGGDERGALALGAARVLRKPLSPDATADAVASVLTSTPALAVPTETAPPSKRKGGLGGLVLSALVAGASAVAFPVVALVGSAWIAAHRAAADSGPTPAGETTAARIVLFFLSPVVALVYMGIMPMVGMQELIKLGAKAEARAGGKPRTGIAGLVSRLVTGGRVWITEGQ